MPDVHPLSAPYPRAALGWDGTSYRVLAVDDEGHVILAPGGVNLRQFNSVWRVTNSGAGDAGSISIYSPVVPAGAIVVLTHAICWIGAGSAGYLVVNVYDGTTQWVLNRLDSPPVGQPLTVVSHAVLVAGNFVRWVAGGVGAGTTFQGWALGYYVQT